MSGSPKTPSGQASVRAGPGLDPTHPSLCPIDLFIWLKLAMVIHIMCGATQILTYLDKSLFDYVIIHFRLLAY